MGRICDAVERDRLAASERKAEKLVKIATDRDIMRELLAEWTRFAADVMPSDAAGMEWLDGLRRRTWEVLK